MLILKPILSVFLQYFASKITGNQYNIMSKALIATSSCMIVLLPHQEAHVNFSNSHDSRVKISDFVTNLWLTKFDVFLLYFRVFVTK